MICYGDLFFGQFCLAILEVFAIRKFWILLAGRFYLVNTELWVLNLEVLDFFFEARKFWILADRTVIFLAFFCLAVM